MAGMIPTLEELEKFYKRNSLFRLQHEVSQTILYRCDPERTSVRVWLGPYELHDVRIVAEDLKQKRYDIRIFNGWTEETIELESLSREAYCGNHEYLEILLPRTAICSRNVNE